MVQRDTHEAPMHVQLVETSRATFDGDPDLDWVEYSDLADFTDDAAHDLDDLRGGQRYVVSLCVGASIPDYSVPDAFAALVGLLKNESPIFHLPNAPELDEDSKARRLVILVGEGATDHLMRVLPVTARPIAVGWLGSLKIVVKLGDLSIERADALVNASNRRLKLGAGVSGALAKAAGPQLQTLMFERLQQRGELEAGDVVTTPASGTLRCRYIIHAATVSRTSEAVRKGLENVLLECERLKVKHVALPALGTGIGGLSLEVCARLFSDVLSNVSDHVSYPKQITCVLWTAQAYRCFERVLTTDLIKG